SAPRSIVLKNSLARDFMTRAIFGLAGALVAGGEWSRPQPPKKRRAARAKWKRARFMSVRRQSGPPALCQQAVFNFFPRAPALRSPQKSVLTDARRVVTFPGQ